MSVTVLKWPANRSADAVLASLRNHPIRDLGLRVMERRAFEAVVWGMPAVQFQLLYQAVARQGGTWNQAAFWSPVAGGKNQTLAADPGEVSFIVFFDTRLAGPMVLELPPADHGIAVSIHNGWQVVLEEGRPNDRSRAGKYLILPPGHDGAVPEDCRVVPCDTWRGFALLRIPTGRGDAEDVIRAVFRGKALTFYPLARSAHPPSTVFVDAAEEVCDATIPYDLRFFEALNRFVQHEPWLARDRAMIDMLRSIGIEKDEIFDPDAALQSVMVQAATEARAWLDGEYEAMLATPYFPKGRWAIPACPDVLAAVRSNFSRQGRYRVDRRALLYSTAFFGARHLDEDRFYLLTTRDADGADLDGGANYRLTVPPGAPVDQSWSVTLYDRDSHALIRGTDRAGRGSASRGLKANPDGSIDLFFGVRPPPGRAGNWLATIPGSRFQVLFRFREPREALFDNSWILPDVQKLK
jgi:hypothetical protein